MADKEKGFDIWGYAAGILTGVTYGMNPLFGKPLLSHGVSVDTVLFFRYFLAFVILGLWLLVRRMSFRVTKAQLFRLLILGVTFSLSSITLFLAYDYIPAGLATTIVFLYPVLVAIISVFLHVYPSWQVWLSICLTFVGVIILSLPHGSVSLHWQGLLLSGASAMSYAVYLVIVNRSTKLRTVKPNVLTFYVLAIGSLTFLVHHLVGGGAFLAGVSGPEQWAEMAGLAVFPTLISLVTLAISTRRIGAVKTSVLGVFEPVTAICIGVLVFGESLTANVIAGIIITIFAVTFMVATGKK
jgi:drug/metabolite transporter (DMT)-like permease